MDIQVLNEIANQVRQASLSQVRLPASNSAPFKALKGNPEPVPENLVPTTLEDSAGQAQDPVAPEISPAARAASVYSAAVGEGLNPDELSAIQDLAGRIRIVASDFLSQPDLEQVETVAELVSSNPEAVEDLASRVEQVVVETLDFAELENEVTTNTSPPNPNLPEEISDLQNFISLERVTNGTEFSNPAAVEEVSDSSRGDFRVTAAGQAVQNLPVDENVRVETPVSQVTVTQQESANRPEVIAANSGEVPVTDDNTAIQNASTDENVQVEVPRLVVAPEQGSVSDLEVVAGNPREVPVTDASPELQNASSSENVQVDAPRPVSVPQQEPVRQPETVATSPQVVAVTDADPELQDAQAKGIEFESPAINTTPPAARSQEPAGSPVRIVNTQESIAQPEQVSAQVASDQPKPQPVSSLPTGSVQSNDLFAQENAAVNPKNIRDVNELVNSVVENEFTSEAKKIFSEPKVIRTVADLADFILERLQEIIATKQLQQKFSSDSKIGVS